MVLRSWERSRSDSREMNGIVSPKSVRPVYSPTSPTMPQRVDPRYGALVCSPFMPGYGGTVPAMFPFSKNESLRLSHPSQSNSMEKQNDRLPITRTSSANSPAVSPHDRNAGSHSPKKNGFSINELLHDSKGEGNRNEKKDIGKVITPERLCRGAEISSTNKLGLNNESPTLEDRKLLEKCKNLDRLRKTDFMRGNIETLDKIRETPYFQRFLPTAAFSHPSLLPPGSLALQLGLQSHPGFLHPPSVYHPFHPSTRSSSPPPLGVPIPVPVYLRGRSGASSSEAARVAKKCRRSRTVFTELQLMGLEKRFEKQKYLSTPDRLELAETLGLSQLQVKTWYQNRRMKWKKQVLQGGGQEAPTKPKGRPKKSDLFSMETTPTTETNQSDESDIESVTSPMSHDSSHLSPLTSPIQRTPSPKPLMPL